MAKAWVIRAGRYGERDQFALREGCSGGGWHDVPDLTSCTSREGIAKIAETTWPLEPDAKRINYTGQLWALRDRIKVGDLLVLPLKTTKQIALGRVTGGYNYRADDPDPNQRHVVTVDWLRKDLPRAAVKLDLLNTLGSALSIFAPSKNDAVRRLEYLLKDGTDPGNGEATVALVNDDILTEAESSTAGVPGDFAQLALDQITARIAQDFVNHDLTTLIRDLLTAEGYRCIQSPPGPDGGIDIVAGRGPLGLDSPRIIVQVKSGGTTVGSPVVNELLGVIGSHGADQGLLVAWAGLTKQAKASLNNQKFKIRVWEAADVVEGVLRTYDRLSEQTRSRLPLRQVWMLADASE